MRLLPQEQLLLVLEAVCKECTAVVELWAPVLNSVVPALSHLAASDKEEGLVRFVSLEAICSVVSFLLVALSSLGEPLTCDHSLCTSAKYPQRFMSAVMPLGM